MLNVGHLFLVGPRNIGEGRSDADGNAVVVDQGVLALNFDVALKVAGQVGIRWSRVPRRQLFSRMDIHVNIPRRASHPTCHLLASPRTSDQLFCIPFDVKQKCVQTGKPNMMGQRFKYA